jgi:hypothetical protein
LRRPAGHRIVEILLSALFLGHHFLNQNITLWNFDSKNGIFFTKSYKRHMTSHHKGWRTSGARRPQKQKKGSKVNPSSPCFAERRYQA